MENSKAPSHWLYCDTLGPIGSGAFLIARLVIGAAFAFHGWPKIQNATGWMGPGAGTPAAFQALAAVAEFCGGLGLMAGLLTRIASFGILCVMIVAMATVHIPAAHPFVSMGGPSYELSVVYLVNMLVFLVLGPGRFSLDALIFKRGHSNEASPHSAAARS